MVNDAYKPLGISGSNDDGDDDGGGSGPVCNSQPYTIYLSPKGNANLDGVPTPTRTWCNTTPRTASGWRGLTARTPGCLLRPTSMRWPSWNRPLPQLPGQVDRAAWGRFPQRRGEVGRQRLLPLLRRLQLRPVRGRAGRGRHRLRHQRRLADCTSGAYSVPGLPRDRTKTCCGSTARRWKSTSTAGTTPGGEDIVGATWPRTAMCT